MQFYNLKKRTHVEVPLASVTKTATRRTLKDGAEQIRYEAKAVDEGTRLSKLLSKEAFDALDVPTA